METPVLPKTTLQLFGEIDDETTKEFLQSIPASGKEELFLEINTPGGDVFDAFVIYDKLNDYKGKITVEVLGLAASMGSVIAMVGDTINIREKAKIMIHNPFTGAFGDAKKFKQAAKNLEEITQDIVNIYSVRTGIKPEEITDMMDSETWLSAAEAVNKGFADKVLESDDKKAPQSFLEQYRSYGFNNIPQDFFDQISESHLDKKTKTVSNYIESDDPSIWCDKCRFFLPAVVIQPSVGDTGQCQLVEGGIQPQGFTSDFFEPIGEPKLESEKRISLQESNIHIIESKSDDGSEWEVIVMEEGLSANPPPGDFYYTKKALESLVSQINDAKAFAYQFKGEIKDLFDHLPERVRDVKPSGFAGNAVGFFKDARVESITRNGKEKNVLVARFIATADWLKQQLKAAWDKGKKDLFGFSIDGYGPPAEHRMIRNVLRKAVDKISKLNEVTVVTEGAAATGNQFLRLLTSSITINQLKETIMRDKLLAILQEKAPHILEGKKIEELTDEDVVKLFESANFEGKAPEGNVDDNGKPKAPESQAAADNGVAVIQQSVKSLAETVNALVKIEANRNVALSVEQKIAEAKLPEASVWRLKESFKGRDLTEDEINREVKLEQDSLAKLKESGQVRGLGQTHKIEIGSEERDKFRIAMDGFMEGQPQKDADGKLVKPFLTLKEAYKVITNNPWGGEDPREILMETYLYMGQIAEYPGYLGPFDEERRTSLRESMQRLHLRESLTVSSFGEILGDSITRKMIREYTLAPKMIDAMKIISEVNTVTDFRTQRRMKLGGYGTLPTVAEAGTYQALTSPTDAEETYSVSKKGGVEDLTMEMIANDDVGAIRRIPVRLARAATETFYRSVFDVFTDNGTMGEDSIALFDSSTHANTLTAALSDAELQTVRSAMRTQSAYNNASEVLGEANAPKFLIVPNELERTAWQLESSPVTVSVAAYVSGETAAEASTSPNINKIKYAIEPIVVDYYTDVNNWFATADPQKQPTIEVGFFQGRREPELFVSDNPTVGSTFTADKISYKIRYIYGVKTLDWRSFHRSVVA